MIAATVRARAIADTAARALGFVAIMTAAAMASGCGAAGRVSTSAACSGLLVSIGEAPHLEPERALADIESVSAVCRRLDAADAGAP